MHTSTLARATYVPEAETTDAETGGVPSFMDSEVTAATLASGDLVKRFDPIAFPQVGVKYTGVDSDGVAVPPPSVAVSG